MSTFISIPDTTLQPGTTRYGPMPDGSYTTLTLSIDRTVAGGLNAVPDTTSIEISIEQSFDGGATWNPVISALVPGGVYPGRHGVGTLNTSVVSAAGLVPGLSSVRAAVAVSGGPVAVAGTLTAS